MASVSSRPVTTFSAMHIRRRLPDLAERRRVLEHLFTGRAADSAFAGRTAEAEGEFARAIAAGAPEQGAVFLVGAGPGAADLLTLRAQRLLRRGRRDRARPAGQRAVLDLARRDAARSTSARRAPTMPAPGGHQRPAGPPGARAGKRVVRLKGGDPFMFGRGGEEAEALAAAGVRSRWCRAITAALACARRCRHPADAPRCEPRGHLRHRPHQGRRARSRLRRAGAAAARRWRSTWASYAGAACRRAGAARSIRPRRRR